MSEVNWFLVDDHDLAVRVVEVSVRDRWIHVSLVFNFFLEGKVNFKSVFVDLIHDVKEIRNYT